MAIKNKKQHRESGFALLIALIVVTALISIGLSVLDLSVRQVRLSSNAADSEIAFHAANAGIECAVYWRRENTAATAMDNGNSISPECFDETPSPASVPGSNANSYLDSSADASAYIYNYEFTWGTPNRCSEIRVLVINADESGDGAIISNANITSTNLFPGYPSTAAKSCSAGAVCSVISVQGYNKACTSTNTYGTVQREVLIQL